MGTRSNIRWAILGYLFGLAWIFGGFAAEVSGWESVIGMWVFIAFGAACFVLFVVGFVKWYVCRTKRLLLIGKVSPDISVNPATREYIWQVGFAVVNRSDEMPVGIREILLRVQRGNGRMELTPIEQDTHQLRPNEGPISLTMTFKCSRILEDIGLEEKYLNAILVIQDSYDYVYEVPAGFFPAYV